MIKSEHCKFLRAQFEKSCLYLPTARSDKTFKTFESTGTSSKNEEGLGKCVPVGSLPPMKNRALSEATWILGTLAAGWLISLALLPVLSILFAGLLLFTLYFFRDPERVPAGDENTAVSAADGVVTRK